jgi:AAA domain-containing protein/bifunctional DNA primase/polymerase-like protein
MPRNRKSDAAHPQAGDLAGKMTDTVTLRGWLAQRGFSPIPCEGKRPALMAWEKHTQTNREEIALWATVYSRAENTGVLTRLMPTIDIDIKNTEAADAIEELARERFEERGYFLVRFGEAPKRAIPLRTNDPFPKIIGNLTAPNGETEKIELLCDGQQVVFFGIHPGTGKPYAWHGGEPGEKIGLDDLPYISHDEARAFVDDATAMLVARFGYTAVAPRPSQRPPYANGGAERAGEGAADWQWLIGNISKGHELHDSTVALAAKMLASGMSDGAAVNCLRGVYHGAAIPHDDRWKERHDDIPRVVRSARVKYGDQQAQPQPTSQQAPTPPIPDHATVYAFPSPDTIPRREWLSRGHYVRGAVTATVAPGGFGKTTLTLFEALMMAAQGLRVWYLSGEDPRVEIDRRVAAHCLHHEVDTATIAGNFFVDDKESFPFSVTRAAKPTIAFDDKALESLASAIHRDKIDVLMIDPFIAFHGVGENDNTAMDQVVKRLGRICAEQNCNIEISHHVRKQAPGQVELTVEDTRGGGSIVNAVRSCRVINRMTSEQADQARVERDKRSSYIRIDKGKRNMAPPETATWMRIVSVPLPNLDNVQAIEDWDFPKLFGEVSTEDRDHFQKLAETGLYAADSRSDKWLGHELASHYRRDVKKQGDVVWINKILSTWVHANLFTKIKKYDPDSRKTRTFFAAVGTPDDTAPPDNPRS